LAANWAGFTPATFLIELEPLRYETVGNYLSLTGDDYHRALVGTARARGLSVWQAEQDAPHFDLPEGGWEEALRLHEVSADYWEAWFTAWQEWVVPRAARAEDNGVELFTPFVWANDTLAAVREVYSGKAGLALIGHLDERLNFLDEVDVVYYDVFAQYLAGHMQDRSEPTIDEIKAVIEELLDEGEMCVGSNAEFYFGFSAESADGQRASENQEERARFVVDFREQVVYYEAFLEAMIDEEWIDGLIIGMDWFDQYRRPPEAWYFDAALEHSPRSKPAEQALRLWLGVE
jgi:hypothetical protein